MNDSCNIIYGKVKKYELGTLTFQYKSIHCGVISSFNTVSVRSTAEPSIMSLLQFNDDERRL